MLEDIKYVVDFYQIVPKDLSYFNLDSTIVRLAIRYKAYGYYNDTSDDLLDLVKRAVQ